MLLAEGGTDTEQAEEQTLLCDAETSGREGSGEIEPPVHLPLPEVMVGMGYTREEIREALTSQKYNEVTATYLLLGRKTEVRRRQGHLGCAMPGVEGLLGQRGQRLRLLVCHPPAGGWGPGHPGAGPGTGAGAQRHHQWNELQQRHQPQQRTTECFLYLPPPAEA